MSKPDKQSWVIESRLYDLEITILDASPEELPKLYNKLHALVDGLPAAIQAHVEREVKQALIDSGNLSLITKTLQNMRPMVLIGRPDGEYAMYWDDKDQVWNRARYADLIAEAKRQLTALKQSNRKAGDAKQY